VVGVTTTETKETTMRPTPNHRARLGIELVTAYLDRDADEDAEPFVTVQMIRMRGGTDTYDDLASGLLILAEWLALQVAHERDPNAADPRAKAREVRQEAALAMPE
jgi:hypothetical protein